MIEKLFTKQFLCVSFLLMLLVFLPLMVLEYVSVRAEGVHDAEWHTVSMAKLLNSNLSHHHPIHQIVDNIQDPQNFAELDNHVNEKIGFLGLVLFRICDRNGKIVYSNDHGLIGHHHQNSQLFSDILSQGLVSKVMSREEFQEEYGRPIEVDVVEVDFPITRPGSEIIDYIIGFYYDYSPIQSRMKTLIMSSLGGLFLLYLVVTTVIFFLFRGKRLLESKVEMLESILPICSHCKNIRIERPGEPSCWQPVEKYFSSENHLKFTHGICDECLGVHYPNIQKLRK